MKFQHNVLSLLTLIIIFLNNYNYNKDPVVYFFITKH